MSTSPADERQENSVCETLVQSSVEDCKLTCLNSNLDGHCEKLNNSIRKESTVEILQNDCQDKAVSNDIKVNGSEEQIGNDVQLDNVDYSADSAFVNKEVIPVRINLTSDELSALTKEEIADNWTQQNKYITYLLAKLDCNTNEEIKTLQGNEEKCKLHLIEVHKKEQYHAMRLTAKEHELQELVLQTDELKACMGGSSLKYCMLDPATYLLFERMKRDLDSTKLKMEETQNELAAWKFTPDSNTGKQLMAKCRLLIKENEELGKMISSGRLSKLEGDLALQRNFGEEFKKSQSEVDEFLQEMDEDTEGMQGTILFLQSQLRIAKKRILQLSGQIAATPERNGASSRTDVDAMGAEEIFPNGGDCDGEDSCSAEKDRSFADESVSMECEPMEVGCKRTRSAVDDDFDGPDMCIPFKIERTKSPELIENGL